MAMNVSVLSGPYDFFLSNDLSSDLFTEASELFGPCFFFYLFNCCSDSCHKSPLNWVRVEPTPFG